MSEDVFQIEYDQMERVATTFYDQVDVVEQMVQTLRLHVGDLQNGGWVGVAADQFFNEMETEVFSALGRLAAALEAGGQLSEQIIDIVGSAEEEAAEQFTYGEPGDAGGGQQGTNPNSP